MKTPITYYGGKQQLTTIILGMIPKHKIYVEPFFGGGAVFFAKGKSYLEVINDRNDLLITFYNECLNNLDALAKRIHETLDSESLWRMAKEIYFHPQGHSNLDIAWAVWCVTNMSIMATPQGGWKRDNGTGGSHFGITMDAYRNNFNKKVHNRLKNVQISCRDALKVIQERDTPETFFYLDPPYIHCDQKHYRGYTPEDFIQLLQALSNIQGKFILSNFWSEELGEYIEMNNWNYQVYNRKCMIPALINKPRRKQEVLVYNYTITPDLFT